MSHVRAAPSRTQIEAVVSALGAVDLRIDAVGMSLGGRRDGLRREVDAAEVATNLRLRAIAGRNALTTLDSVVPRSLREFLD